MQLFALKKCSKVKTLTLLPNVYEEIQLKINEIKKRKSLTNQDLANLWGVSEGTVKNYLRKDKPTKIPIQHLEKLSDKYQIDLNWLLKGTHDKNLHILQPQTTLHRNREEFIAPDKTDNSGINQLVSKGEPSAGMIPFYSYSTMSSVALFGEQKNEPTGYIQVPGFSECVAVTVYGNSMSPLFDSGEIIFCKPIKNRNSVIFGDYYYVMLEEYNLVRQLLQAENKDCVILASEKQGKQEIRLSDILQLYHIQGNIKRRSV